MPEYNYVLVSLRRALSTDVESQCDHNTVESAMNDIQETFPNLNIKIVPISEKFFNLIKQQIKDAESLNYLDIIFPSQVYERLDLPNLLGVIQEKSDLFIEMVSNKKELFSREVFPFLNNYECYIRGCSLKLDEKGLYVKYDNDIPVIQWINECIPDLDIPIFELIDPLEKNRQLLFFENASRLTIYLSDIPEINKILLENWKPMRNELSYICDKYDIFIEIHCRFQVTSNLLGRYKPNNSTNHPMKNTSIPWLPFIVFQPNPLDHPDVKFIMNGQWLSERLNHNYRYGLTEISTWILSCINKKLPAKILDPINTPITYDLTISTGVPTINLSGTRQLLITGGSPTINVIGGTPTIHINGGSPKIFVTNGNPQFKLNGGKPEITYS